MLVQDFLRIVALNPSNSRTRSSPPKRFPTMKADGIFGDITANWIVAFQEHLKRIGRPIFVDGVVDRVINGIAPSPNGLIWTKGPLTITLCPVTGDRLWAEWLNERTVPPL